MMILLEKVLCVVWENNLCGVCLYTLRVWDFPLALNCIHSSRNPIVLGRGFSTIGTLGPSHIALVEGNKSDRPQCWVRHCSICPHKAFFRHFLPWPRNYYCHRKNNQHSLPIQGQWSYVCSVNLRAQASCVPWCTMHPPCRDMISTKMCLKSFRISFVNYCFVGCWIISCSASNHVACFSLFISQDCWPPYLIDICFIPYICDLKNIFCHNYNIALQISLFPFR